MSVLVAYLLALVGLALAVVCMRSESDRYGALAGAASAVCLVSCALVAL